MILVRICEKRCNVVSLESAVRLVIYLIVGGLIFGILFWLLDYCAIPEPFNKVARVILVILAALVVIGVLLSFIGHPIFV